jgi:hypothetical protein
MRLAWSRLTSQYRCALAVPKVITDVGYSVNFHRTRFWLPENDVVEYTQVNLKNIFCAAEPVVDRLDDSSKCNFDRYRFTNLRRD